MAHRDVYIIDDEKDIINMLSSAAEIAGLTCAGFTQAGDFFDSIAETNTKSVLILDLHMPEMDGIEVIRRLAKMKEPPVLILMSGHDSGILHSAEKLTRAHNLNILAALSKPININNFINILMEYFSLFQDKKTNEINSNISNITLGEKDLSMALLNNELVLFYQPQIDIVNKKLIGVEALIRWQHPQKGLLFPDLIIPIAEQFGLMESLTLWVIKKAIEDAHTLPVPVSVNISAENITSLSLPEKLTELLQKNKLDPANLILEVTETALMGELITSLDILTRLRLKGIGLSIDDFGTGYSSLSQLHKIPFTELKIDQSFVGTLSEDEESKAIVKTCIMLGHELKMKVVAEGVETQEQFEQLSILGCDIAQGYLFSKPVPIDDLLLWFENYHAYK